MGKKDLLYITTIARFGSISKAAGELMVAQPSITRCLQRVEEELGMQLFLRTGDGLVPTQAGEIYLENAYQILRTYREMERKIASAAELKGGRVKIGATSFLASFILPEILAVFHSLYPGVAVDVEESRSADVRRALEQGMLDVGFQHTPFDQKGLDCVPLGRERFLLAVPPDDPIGSYSYERGRSGERYLDLALTPSRNFICTHPGQQSRTIMDGIFQRAGFEPRIHYQTRSIQTALRMTHAGLGFTLAPHSYLTLLDRAGRPDCYFLEPGLRPSWELMGAVPKGPAVTKGAREILRIAGDVVPFLYKEDAPWKEK